MNKSAIKPYLCVVACAVACIFAFSLIGCASGASSSGSGSSSSAGSSNAINLDKAVTQSGLSYKVSSSWTQSGNGATASSSGSSSSSASSKAASSGENAVDGSAYSQCSFKTGEGNNALQVTTDDVAFTISPEDGLEKMRSAWIDYQGGTDWNVSSPKESKIGGATCTEYTCTWSLKNGDKATARVAFVQGDNVNATISYYFNSGDDAIFDAVMKTVSVD